MIFANNNGGRAPTNMKLNSRHMIEIKNSNRFPNFVNTLYYNNQKQLDKICGLIPIVDDKIKEIEVF